jgi:hypothetical protein
VQSPTAVLLHEASHAFRFATDRKALDKAVGTPDAAYGNEEERHAIEGIESRSARILGQPIRTTMEESRAEFRP